MKRFFATLVLAAGFALTTPAAANAVWTYIGPLPGLYDGDCLWYPFTGQCSGWNTWAYIDTYNNGGGTILNGFENYNRIRGQWIASGGHRTTLPSDVGMGGYLKAQVTNNSGVTADVDAYAAA
jgi:hypothetical protein